MATKTLLTLADYAALPVDGKRYELVEGELVELTFPNLEHSRIQAFLMGEIYAYLKSHPVGQVGTDFGFILGRDPDTLRGPDVYFVTRERARRLDPKGWADGAPDLAVEILSPSNSRRDVERKIAHYLGANAQVIWVVDPRRRQVRVIDSHGETVLTEDQSLTAPDLLPGFSVSIREALDA